MSAQGFNFLNFKYHEVYTYECDAEDDEGIPVQFRATTEYGDDVWHIEKWDSYHGEWYDVEGKDRCVTRMDMRERITELVNEVDGENT